MSPTGRHGLQFVAQVPKFVANGEEDHRLDRAVRRITETYDLPVTVAPEVASAVLARARARDAGARAVEAVISGELMPGLAGLILDRLAEEGAPPRAVEIATGPDGSLTPRLS